MRFIMLVKASPESEAGQRPTEEMLEAMGRYTEEIRRAGVLIDAAGLQPTSRGARVRYSGNRTQVVDGPFTESKELVGGYSIIEAKSLEEAIAWAMKMPNPAGSVGEVEIRPLYSLDDFGPSEAVDTYFRGKGYSAES